MRLIDADKLIQEMHRIATETNSESIHIDCLVDEAVGNAPTVDAVPVVHGMWIAGVCTHCGFDFRELTDGENDLEQWVWDEGFPHCPRCGAKMDGGNEE